MRSSIQWLRWSLSGRIMLSTKDFEEYSRLTLGKAAGDYYRSGANEQHTLAENENAFKRIRIRPRFLNRDVSQRDQKTTFLGTPVEGPIGVAPTAMQRMAHPDGELATARACQSAGNMMILSTIATSSIEEVAEAAPTGPKWFQLYIYKDRKVTERLVKRAQENGFKALVLTVDTPFFGTRFADARNRFNLPPHLKLANFADPKGSKLTTSKDAVSGLNAYANSLFDASLTWKDVEWLKTITTLPIVVKGILTGEDALLALNHGAKAIIVSNHGARQLDGVPATIEALPEIVGAVGGRCEVYIDGGIRTGTDVLKALALGATGVFVGRPIIWGLCYQGEEGVKQVLHLLHKELDVAMALSGCAQLGHITRDLVTTVDRYWARL